MVTFPTAGPATLTLRHTGEVVKVQVYNVAFDNVSKKTSSTDVGTDAPPAPPDDADQLVVVASQLPVPPTQYLFATVIPQSLQLVAC